MPEKGQRSKTIQIAKTDLLIRYLDAIKLEEQFGNDHTTIAKSLLWRGIEDLISRDRIDRLKPLPSDNAENNKTAQREEE